MRSGDRSSGSAEGSARVEYALDVPGLTARLDEVRDFVVRVVAAGRVASHSDVAQRLRLAASELFTNAIEAAPGGPIEIRVGIEPTEAHITVRNPGSASDVILRPSRGGLDPLALRGRGLVIIESLSRTVSVESVVEDGIEWVEVVAVVDID